MSERPQNFAFIYEHHYTEKIQPEQYKFEEEKFSNKKKPIFDLGRETRVLNIGHNNNYSGQVNIITNCQNTGNSYTEKNNCQKTTSKFRICIKKFFVRNENFRKKNEK
ncbi:hypothetical protein PVAND_016324 [Polypedilum vanderplanki]|uniref:Uncharacterized protein n=1 Tax=Polypedilum vanderplanki TaxID=319348 RepID=A0A9J6BFI5_POLVA|nr:hypothetical protein PVAND_016324 [Polypedilum vanderplanki]